MFDQVLLNKIGTSLKKNNQSIAVAESVTGGLLQTALSNADEASLFFQGGVTAYNIGQKCRHLSIEPLHALKYNSVSKKIAEDLSRNICTMFQSDYGIGITGYAAKAPDKNINELFAYYAIAFKGKILKSAILKPMGKEEGFAVQLYYTESVLKRLSSSLSSK